MCALQAVHLDWTLFTLFVSLLAVGDTVSEDEVVCEIETDKVRSVDETPLKQGAATNNSFNN